VSEINSQNRLGWNRERPLSGEQFGNMKFGRSHERNLRGDSAIFWLSA